MKIFKGQRPDTYQPGLPGPGLVHLYFQGLKARHIKILFEKRSCICVGPSALFIEENAAPGPGSPGWYVSRRWRWGH